MFTQELPAVCCFDLVSYSCITWSPQCYGSSYPSWSCACCHSQTSSILLGTTRRKWILGRKYPLSILVTDRVRPAPFCISQCRSFIVNTHPGFPGNFVKLQEIECSCSSQEGVRPWFTAQCITCTPVGFFPKRKTSLSSDAKHCEEYT